MTDRYERIRLALAMGPTPGPWIVTHELRECDETVCDLVNGTWIVTAPGVKLAHWEYDAAHIAACDPDTIRALLDERDALAAEVERLREALKSNKGTEMKEEDKKVWRSFYERKETI